MIVIFVLGYGAIALEHPLKTDKAASALLTGTILWAIYALNAEGLLSLDLSPAFKLISDAATDVMNFIHPKVAEEHFKNVWESSVEVAKEPHHFILHDLEHHLVEVAEILFFLLGAMTIVETVDQHQGFKIITDRITTNSKVKLLWILSFIAFFMSAALDNLTTTIVMLALLRKLIGDQKTRWFFASVIVIAANAGGAWSPIGDVTTIMLWIGGQITAASIIVGIIIPSLINLIVPISVMSFFMKGDIPRPELSDADKREFTTPKERNLLFFLGVGALLFVPIFKTVTHLPPFLGMLLGLGVIWTVTEFLHKHKPSEDKRKLTVAGVISKVDIPTIFFFLGILMAVAALQSVGVLAELSTWLDTVTDKNIYVISAAIGILSSIVDNVPLVAGAMGMYPLAEAGAFMVDGTFWHLIAYTAGTGGSILIIGSAAGVAAMGLEKIDFIWYMKNISLWALLGYFAGLAYYILEVTMF
jgi:Na+/H+ antiporter NhaD/arsenite permease-like protein